MNKVLGCFAIAALLAGCTRSHEKIPPVTSMDNASGKIVIYQIMTRLFGDTASVNKPYGTIEENGVGKFNDINDAALTGIKNLGVTHVWYTGVIEHAVLSDYLKYGIALDDADVVKGRAGSPYAIKDYYDVNPDLAVDVPNRMKEFERLVERTHGKGLKVIIDFVPNHVARGYHSDVKPESVRDLGDGDDTTVSFKASNNFYYLPGQSFQVPADYVALGAGNNFPTKDGKFDETPARVTGNDQFTAAPGINEWFETIKLNYGVDIQLGHTTHFDPIPSTWEKMRDILLFWTAKKVDGFRCDMAEMVPVEFWNWVIPQIKEVNPDIVFIAEIYNPQQYHNYIQRGKFDFLYDKVQLYDTLRTLITGGGDTRDIHRIQESLHGINRHMLHFLENHDEQRIASKFFAGDPWKAIPGMVVSAMIDRGPVMIYFGQEVGEPAIGAEGFQGDDGRTTIFDYWGVPEHQKWMNHGRFDGALLSPAQKQLRQAYADILTLANTNAAIRQGDYLDLTAHNINAGNFKENVHAFIRYTNDEKLLVLTSFAPTPQPVTVQLPADAVSRLGLDAKQTYTLKDLLWRKTEAPLSSSFTYADTLKPYGSFVFRIK